MLFVLEIRSLRSCVLQCVHMISAFDVSHVEFFNRGVLGCCMAYFGVVSQTEQDSLESTKLHLISGEQLLSTFKRWRHPLLHLFDIKYLVYY